MQVETYTNQTSDYWNVGVDCQSDLATRIANHQSFINLNALFEQALNMPDPTTFTQSFDSSQVRQGGHQYLSTLTGISLNTMTSLNNSIIGNTQSLLSSFPELTNMSEQELEAVLLQATDNYIAATQASAKSCADCKREGRANMVQGIVIGGLTGTGSGTGPFGIWAGAVVGFWYAAEVTAVASEKILIYGKTVYICTDR